MDVRSCDFLSLGRRVQRLAKGLADLMWNPESTFTGGASDSTPSRLTGRSACAAAYLEDEGDHYRYRYAVLYGGEAAVRALRTAALDPRDSDEAGPNRRVALASYPDYEDFIYRLPTFLSDVARRLEGQLARRAPGPAPDADLDLVGLRRVAPARPPLQQLQAPT